MQTTQSAALVPSDVEPIDLQTALAGDLSKLPAESRLKFYGALCQSTGLNPLTKPFDWLTFQGKLVLYANKGCAEQLRKIHGVTVEIIERKVEFGCLIVRVKATDKSGRVDESIGALPFNEKAGGEASAIAMMKCETKAKRRVTLSICGLGLLDESEIGALKESPVVAAMAGEESAHARAERLNQALTSGEKEKAIDISAVGESNGAPVAGSGQERESRSETPAAKPIRVEVQSPFTPPVETLPTERPITSPLATEGRTAEKSSVTAPPAVLTDDEAMNLEIVLTEHQQPKRCIEYMVKCGALPAGTGIEHLKRAWFEKIIKNKDAFFRNVNAFIAGGAK